MSTPYGGPPGAERHNADSGNRDAGMRHRAIIVLVMGAVLAALILAGSVASRTRSERPPDENLLASFRGNSALTAADYDSLATYFMQGFERFKAPAGSAAAYPGLPSEHGESVDQLEGFSRMAPLWAVWVASGRPANIRGSDGQRIDLVAEFRRGLLAGTNKHGRAYWGTIHDNDQRIVEASDIALALWLMRDQVWAGFTPAEQKQVVEWLQQVDGKEVFDNNWHLFVVFVDAVLNKLAAVDNRAEALKHYSRIKQFYRGEGWFSDGPNDVYDYYNAWGIHYQLFWLQQVSPEWDKEFIDEARSHFVSSYRFLMTPEGFPILGRSVCYRMAAPAPLILTQFDTHHVDAAEARRALDTTWRYFIQHGGVKDGNITQGYCGADAWILDRYSGPASCLWGLRSLIAALYLPRHSEFWHAAGGKLAVEQADVAVEIKSIGWSVRGYKKTGDVEITPTRNPKNRFLQPQSKDDPKKTLRPDNYQAKYGAAVYKIQPSILRMQMKVESFGEKRRPKNKCVMLYGAGRGGRTPMTRRSTDFESVASASSAIPAQGRFLNITTSAHRRGSNTSRLNDLRGLPW